MRPASLFAKDSNSVPSDFRQRVFVFQTRAKVGLDDLFVGFDFGECALGEHAAFGHADDGVAQAADEIHVVFDHDETCSRALC